MKNSNFAIKYLRENKNLHETVFACLYGAQIESFKQKNGWKSSDTVLFFKRIQGWEFTLWFLVRIACSLGAKESNSDSLFSKSESITLFKESDCERIAPIAL